MGFSGYLGSACAPAPPPPAIHSQSRCWCCCVQLGGFKCAHLSSDSPKAQGIFSLMPSRRQHCWQPGKSDWHISNTQDLGPRRFHSFIRSLDIHSAHPVPNSESNTKSQSCQVGKLNSKCRATLASNPFQSNIIPQEGKRFYAQGIRNTWSARCIGMR